MEKRKSEEEPEEVERAMREALEEYDRQSAKRKMGMSVWDEPDEELLVEILAEVLFLYLY